MTTTHQAQETDHTHSNDELLTMAEAAAVIRIPLATLRY
ncbi:MAG: hypothetical protein QOI06_75 [Nocardioidaceae bacterium]|jgi:hypothetical protein|nr:hypothetical protein [Nocardioidaceae bacterium]